MIRSHFWTTRFLRTLGGTYVKLEDLLHLHETRPWNPYIQRTQSELDIFRCSFIFSRRGVPPVRQEPRCSLCKAQSNYIPPFSRDHLFSADLKNPLTSRARADPLPAIRKRPHPRPPMHLKISAGPHPPPLGFCSPKKPAARIPRQKVPSVSRFANRFPQCRRIGRAIISRNCNLRRICISFNDFRL